MARSKPLIIVESPAKAKTISRFLGTRYQVKASMGHVRDLPKSQFGVDVDNGFKPRYITIRGKGPLLKELKDAAKKSDRIYLATDPDREGEAISWHLAEALHLAPQDVHRIEFHEITKDAVSHAIKEARPIDMGLVNAQQARRVLDRVVGYQLSPLLWRKVRPGLSAGRVQSAALKLLVDREDAVQRFVPEQYFTVDMTAVAENGELLSHYYAPLGHRGRVTAQEMEQILQGVKVGAQVVVSDVKTKEKRRFPALPFTTSTLQQEASRKLGLSVKRTMSLAQQLYEGLEVPGEGTVGLVTYIRTDSTRIGDGARDEAREYIAERFGPAYVPESGQIRQSKAKPGVQDAHEAIRPTNVRRHPDMLKGALNRDQLRLYRLIWERFVASQMAAMVYESTTIDVAFQDQAKFRATGSRVLFPGYSTVYQESFDEADPQLQDDDTKAKPLLDLVAGTVLTIARIEPQEHFTEPPPRYTEASLVKTLEELGIGRPSTYAPIVETLLHRDYVRRDQKKLIPTDLGRVVVDLLQHYFPEIVDTRFTAEIETELDHVAADDMQWQDVLKGFYERFSEELAKADDDIEKVDLPLEETDEVCEKCGRPMMVKYGRFGKFLACSGYPECDFTKPYVEKTGALCPKCHKDLVVRRTRKGRTFYGCVGYPECDFVTWNRPSDKVCPRCGSSMAFKRRGNHDSLMCLREGCGYEEEQAQ
ncbi:type I DNA topoisomerase [Sulfobacillus sp. hq2]|uniref:type I DNA topoisomerase n=1 Tax=Sulfobacillus TaxID=28033 RepID=UPI000CCFD498|nr:type I DNA topoisomerase [Sulfobacillus sp. hq2]POB09159.1 DNA topoisomerase I [Sulfobacillus sp. hq2]